MLKTLLFLTMALGAEPAAELLWPGSAPASVGDPAANRPTLTAYLPEKDKAVGTAVVVCPGGGYGALAIDHEGKQVAEWLNQHGVAAFVLRYRIAGPKRPAPLHPAPMLDVQRAIRTVRANAKKYGVAPDRIGVWGFSAGGHLASTAATHFDNGHPAEDVVEEFSCRPNFAILAYPVVSMEQGSTHGGSRRNLLGNDPDPKLVELMSNDKQVTKETPPTFLFHTDDDKAVPVMNSVLFFTALKKNGVPAEMHVYEHGRHGVGLALNDPVLSNWPHTLEAWMKGRDLLTPTRQTGIVAPPVRPK
jgi:acetyl esterase/lipase